MTNTIRNKTDNPTTVNKESLGAEEVITFSDKELSFKVYKSSKACRDYLRGLNSNDPFFSESYFRIIEQNNLGGALPMYAFAFLNDEDTPIGFYYLQKKLIQLGDSIDTEKFVEGASFWAKAKYMLQKIFFPMVTFHMMIVGNLLLTGKYGFRGQSDSLKDGDYDLLKRLLRGLKKKVRKSDYRYSGALIKDFDNCNECSDPKRLGLGKFEVDPSMIVHIRPDWNSMDDYLLDMKSKHRVRTKKHLKKGASLEIRSLDIDEIETRNDHIYTLYKSVIKASGFNLATVGPTYFLELAKAFPDNFTVKGIFLEDELVGFYSYMLKEGAMMSHFIGYNESKNKEHSIYMNILLGLIRDAISVKVKKLFYYRTALEIKSSVGAEPESLTLYLMHNNSVLNKCTNFIIKTFFPVPVWTQRKPFKNYPES